MALAPFRVPGGGVTAWLALATIAALLTSVDGVEFRNVGVVVAFGLVIRALVKWRRG